ncbi:ATP-binding protein [Streptomyces monticola]|uniref:ATP-binding protein n=1 Tax=Streptomyces monticola TaxID=2666263 RepID=A0ABW2JLN9_9ACTN
MADKGFVGRLEELAALQQLCAHSRLVTLTGPGGVGKTRTALRTANRIAPQFPDGTWLVELSSLQDGEILCHTVTATLQATDHTTRPQEEVLADHLADKRLLLVLDTCEHLIGPVTELVELLLGAAPHLHILATSRQPLGVDGEQTFVLGPLGTTDEAPELFVQRASTTLHGFAATPGDRATIEKICARLDGIPLAVELAAGRLRTGTTLQELLDGLDDRFQILGDEDTDGYDTDSYGTDGYREGGYSGATDWDTPGPEGVPPSGACLEDLSPGGVASGAYREPRHSTLRTTIGWSHELCPPRERLLWARLAVFPGDFSLAAARHVCADDALAEQDIPALLGGLAGKSLLLREPGPDGERFRQLDTVRAYGIEWLRRLDEEVAQRTRHLAWCQNFAERGEHDWFGPGQTAVFHATRREHTHLCTALDFALTTPGYEHAGARLAGTLWFYWVGCGLLSDGRYWLDRALDALHAPGSRDRLKALWVNGYIAILQGDSETAVRMLSHCRAEALRAGDDTAFAYATHRLGCAALTRDEHFVAQRFFESALNRYRDLGELNSNVMMARIELAMTLAFQGDLATAVAQCNEAKRLCERHGERWAKAYALYVLAFAAWAGGRHEEATGLAQECLAINHEFRDLVGMVLPIEFIALLHTSQGRSRQAAVLQGAARSIWAKVGLPLFGSAHFNAPHETALTLALKDLGEVAYAECFARGTRLSIDETVELALAQGPSAQPEPRAARA